MSKLTILEFPDPRLRTVAKPVSVFDEAIKTLVADMFETMYEANGIGLAATQVNVHQRVFVMDISEQRDAPQALINPRIVEKSGEQVYQEGCLSFPGLYADVERAGWVRIEAEDTEGQTFSVQADGLMAVCIQHELDHLDGKVFVDYLSPLKRNMLLKRLQKQRKQAS
ncbi:peptide deformylase [Oleiagrimonas sp. C23AA]|uniref:peptide deformylase n=1 Tax=Oleiagrimonas sp. C23AA TaxID=2719047 RepID=UPI00141FF40B|nr:peptide deformylase [Oleiagrimonas sp. C23AA]NII10831.1 peptide deformylase [Oleiagrimonas sp. C23AA]